MKLLPDPTIDGYADHDHRIIDLSRHVAFQLAANGTDVILDEGFWSREERRAMRWQIEALGAIARIYVLDTPMDTIRERVAARNTAPSPDSFRIDRDVLESYLPFWHPPGDDEDVIRIVDQKEHQAKGREAAAHGYSDICDGIAESLFVVEREQTGTAILHSNKC